MNAGKVSIKATGAVSFGGTEHAAGSVVHDVPKEVADHFVKHGAAELVDGDGEAEKPAKGKKKPAADGDGE